VNDSHRTRDGLSVLATAAILSTFLATSAPAGDQDAEWAKGVGYTTDWKKAIKTARESGKMIFVYNGWARSGI